MTITQQEIAAGLEELGLRVGHKVLVHSSLRSFGHVAGGADAVIDAVLEVIGPSGTLLAPTLTGSGDLSAENPPYFDPDATPCWTGIIPETLRRRPVAVRSLHPTHSVAAIGADAVFLTAGHRCSVTPCDELSPFGRLAALPDSYVLLLGVSHESNTLFHYVEEMAGVEYHIQRGFVSATMCVQGVVSRQPIMLHRYGAARRFSVMEPVFLAQGIQRQGRIGQAEVRLIQVAGMVRTTLRALLADKSILLDNMANPDPTN